MRGREGDSEQQAGGYKCSLAIIMTNVWSYSANFQQSNNSIQHLISDLKLESLWVADVYSWYVFNVLPQPRGYVISRTLSRGEKMKHSMKMSASIYWDQHLREEGMQLTIYLYKPLDQVSTLQVRIHLSS